MSGKRADRQADERGRTLINGTRGGKQTMTETANIGRAGELIARDGAPALSQDFWGGDPHSLTPSESRNIEAIHNTPTTNSLCLALGSDLI